MNTRIGDVVYIQNGQWFDRVTEDKVTGTRIRLSRVSREDAPPEVQRRLLAFIRSKKDDKPMQ